MKTKLRYIRICLYGKRKLLKKIRYKNLVLWWVDAINKLRESPVVSPEKFDEEMKEVNLEFFSKLYKT